MLRIPFKNPTGKLFRPSLRFQIEASPIKINSTFVPAKFGARVFSDVPEMPKIPVSLDDLRKFYEKQTGEINDKVAEGEKKQAEREIKAKKFRHETREKFQDMREKIAGKFDVWHGYKIAAGVAGVATAVASAVNLFAFNRIELMVTQTNMSVDQMKKDLSETEKRLERRIEDGNANLEAKIAIGAEKVNLMYKEFRHEKEITNRHLGPGSIGADGH